MNQQLVVYGQLISYAQFGQLNAEQTVIFLHGWRSNKEVWGTVVSKLTSQSANRLVSCYTLDLPGFGQSPAPKQPWSVSEYANLVAEFITKIDLKNVTVVGHSFGGRVAIKLAATRADLVKKLVLADAAGFAMNQNKKSAINLAAKVVKPIFKPKFMQGLRKKIYKSIGAEDYLATPELQQTFINTVNEDLTENVKRILQPTLIVWGQNDTATPISQGEKMHKLISNSQFLIFKNAGHFSFLDQPEQFVKALTGFI